jgi:streptogramin lyase
VVDALFVYVLEPEPNLMKFTPLAAALLLTPSLASSQVIARPPLIAKQPLVLAVREPALYVYEDYVTNGSRLMHYVDDMTGKAHSSEPVPSGGIQSMASDRNGNVYAAVWVGPSQPSHVVQMKKSGRFTGPLKRATAVATDQQGRIYITDGDLGQVLRIDDLNGSNLVTFGAPGSGIGQLSNPQGITVDKAGHIYIADTGNNRIVRIDDMSGEGWRTYNGAEFGSQGKQVITPRSIAVDSKGRLYYAKWQSGTIIRVDDMSGANMTSWSGSSTVGRDIIEPTAIAIDANDRIYIADIATGFVSRIDDITGANRILLNKDASGPNWRRPSNLAVFYPRADRTIIR